MPETIRAVNGRPRSRTGRGLCRAGYVAWLCVVPAPLHAEDVAFTGILAGHDLAALTLTLALVCFGVLATLVLLRTRRNANRAENVSREEAIELSAEIDRLKALLLSEPQVLVEWPAARDEPEILGDTALFVPAGVPQHVVSFATWLEPAAARRMEQAVERLRRDGRGFAMTLTSSAGKPVEADGRAVGGRAVLRLRDVGGIEHELIALGAAPGPFDGRRRRHAALLDALPAAGLDARRARRADVRQCGLCARGRRRRSR